MLFYTALGNPGFPWGQIQAYVGLHADLLLLWLSTQREIEVTGGQSPLPSCGTPRELYQLCQHGSSPGRDREWGAGPLNPRTKGHTQLLIVLCVWIDSQHKQEFVCADGAAARFSRFFIFFLIWLTAKMIFVGTLCLFCTLLICCCVQPGEENPSQVLEHSCLRPSCCLGIGSFLRR